MIKRGPVDVIVMAAGVPRFDGSVLKELERLSAAGTIRVLDALVLLKDEKGTTVEARAQGPAAGPSRRSGLYPQPRRGVFSTPRMPPPCPRAWCRARPSSPWRSSIFGQSPL